MGKFRSANNSNENNRFENVNTGRQKLADYKTK